MLTYLAVGISKYNDINIVQLCLRAQTGIKNICVFSANKISNLRFLDDRWNNQRKNFGNTRMKFQIKKFWRGVAGWAQRFKSGFEGGVASKQ